MTGICFGLFIASSLRAVAADFPTGGFSDDGMLWLVGIELALATAALTVLHLRGFAIASLLPVPTLRGGLAGVGLLVAVYVIGGIVVSPFAAGQGEQPIARMVEEAKLTLPVILLVAMVNGLYEEVFLMGFLLRGLRGFGLSTALGAMLLVRVLYHLYQGPVGALWVLVCGLVFGLYYIRSNRLWPPVFAHMLLDILPLVGW